MFILSGAPSLGGGVSWRLGGLVEGPACVEEQEFFKTPVPPMPTSRTPEVILVWLDTPLPEGREFLWGTDLCQLSSQRVCQKPLSHSLDIEPAVTFTQNICCAIHIGIEYSSVTGTVKSPLDALITKLLVLMRTVPNGNLIAIKKTGFRGVGFLRAR